jgi:hypothetical protein
MEQEDYLKRQIDQLGLVLGKLLTVVSRLNSGGQVPAGIEMTDQTLKTELHLSLEELLSIPVERLISRLQESNVMNPGNCEKLAGILAMVAEGLNISDPGNPKIREINRYALALFEHVDNTGSTYSYDRHVKIDKLKSMG